MILLFILFESKILSFILWKECRLKMFKNRVLSRKFEPKRRKVIRDYRKLHNEELHNFILPKKVVAKALWHVVGIRRQGNHVYFWS